MVSDFLKIKFCDQFAHTFTIQKIPEVLFSLNRDGGKKSMCH